jgi:hypothetical protein
MRSTILRAQGIACAVGSLSGPTTLSISTTRSLRSKWHGLISIRVLADALRSAGLSGDSIWWIVGP